MPRPGAPLAPPDWRQPWLQPWQAVGRPVWARVEQGASVAEALNAALGDAGGVELAAGPLRFVPQAALPAGEAYEAFICRTACVPTRDNLHDFHNGLAWLRFPRTKRQLNALQAAELARTPERHPHGGTAAAPTARGPVRDALTLFDENAALWRAPPVLADALRRRDWVALFQTHRALWQPGSMPVLFGHALLEKLAAPRKAITAHVWLVDGAPPGLHPQGTTRRGRTQGDGACCLESEGEEWVDALLPDMLLPRTLAARPFLPLPVLGVPGWWAPNAGPGFYDDPAVFRPPRQRLDARSPGGAA